MLREGAEFTDEESETMRQVANKVKETSHYSLAELTPANYTFSLKLKVPRKNLDKGEHAIQVVQFDKDKVIFCKTVHYTVE